MKKKNKRNKGIEEARPYDGLLGAAPIQKYEFHFIRYCTMSIFIPIKTLESVSPIFSAPIFRNTVTQRIIDMSRICKLNYIHLI